MAWLAGAAYRALLTVDGTVPSLSGSVTLPAAAALLAGLKAYCGASGEKLRFTSSDGETLIPYGIEDWSAAAPIVHFRDTFGTGDTYIYAYALSSGSDAQNKAAVAQDFNLYLPLGDSGPTAYDWTGSYNASSIGTPAFSETGKIAGAVRFDGSNEALNAGAVPAKSNNMTVMCWAKPNALSLSYPRLVDRGSTTTAYFLGLGGSLGAAKGQVSAGFGTVNSYKNTNAEYAAAGTWMHVAVTTSDGATPVIYTDGVLRASTAIGAWTSSDVANLYIGNRYLSSAYDRDFDGWLDQVCVASSTFTVDQIAFCAKAYPGSTMFSWGSVEAAPSAGSPWYYNLQQTILTGNAL